MKTLKSLVTFFSILLPIIWDSRTHRYRLSREKAVALLAALVGVGVELNIPWLSSLDPESLIAGLFVIIGALSAYQRDRAVTDEESKR